MPPLRALVAAGHEVIHVVTRADKRRGRGAELSPEPGQGRRRRARPPRVPPRRRRARLGCRARRGGRIRPDHQTPRARRAPHGQPALQPAAALAGSGAGGAGDPRRRRRDRGVRHGCRRGTRHRRRVRRAARRHRPDRDGAGVPRPARRRRHPAAPRGARPSRRDRGAEPQVGEPTYASKVTPDDLRLDWSRPAVELARLPRAGKAWTTFRGRRLLVLEARAVSSTAEPANPAPSTGQRVWTGRGRAWSSSPCNRRARPPSRPRRGAAGPVRWRPTVSVSEALVSEPGREERDHGGRGVTG